jgi:hypothetical protein
MKKPLVLIAAIVAGVGLCSPTAVAKETIKVETSLTLHPDFGNNYAFAGRVKASRGCQEGRTVTLTRAGKKVGSDKSNDCARYKIIVKGHDEPWTWRDPRAVAMERKTTKDNGDKIVCKRASSRLQED